MIKAFKYMRVKYERRIRNWIEINGKTYFVANGKDLSTVNIFNVY